MKLQPLVSDTARPSCHRYVAEQHGGPAAKHAKARELLYGCQDGRLVQLLVDAGAVRQGFVIHSKPSSKESMKAAVTAIHCGADYSKVSRLPAQPPPMGLAKSSLVTQP